VDVGAVIRKALGERGDLRKIRFREAGRLLEWYVPDDSIWMAVKDNLVVREYERCGINLSAAQGTVIDAGANAGLFALRAAVHARKVIALEPHPSLHELLRLNIRHNAVQNIEALSKALWVGDDGVELVEGVHSGNASIFGGRGRRFQVESMTLDSLVANVGSVDLLKLDIEGAEFAILSDSRPETLAQISNIVAELHLEGREWMLPRTIEHLQTSGFRVTVRDQPIRYWRETVDHTLGGWHDLAGLVALKTAVLWIYSLAALARWMSVPRALQSDNLKFLYASRTPPLPRGIELLREAETNAAPTAETLGANSEGGRSLGRGEAFRGEDGVNQWRVTVAARVAVVVPTRNFERTFEICPRSLGEQTVPLR
jgi:FkbM family methyltransferase